MSVRAGGCVGRECDWARKRPTAILIHQLCAYYTHCEQYISILFVLYPSIAVLPINKAPILKQQLEGARVSTFVRVQVVGDRCCVV